MFILGHAGITLGAALLLNGALAKGNAFRPKKVLELSPEKHSTRNQAPPHLVSWFAALRNRIDIRLLLIASLLPDIIDKPIGQLLFKETFSNGRIFCHTLLFLILLTSIGIYLQRKYGKNWFLVLAFGSFTHLIFDQIWQDPKTLFWPLFGFAFEKMELDMWIGGIFYNLLNEPSVYVPEIAGGLVLALYAWVLVRNRKTYALIRRHEVLDA